MKQVVATVISNRKVVMGVTRPHTRSSLGNWIIWLNYPEIAREAKAGQFVMVRCGEECILPRPFSIHQVKGEDIALLFDVWENGKGTNWLSQRQVGDLVKMPIPKPLGNGFTVQTGSRNLLLVAGGVGIAPLYFLAQEALRKDYSVTMLYGTRTKHRYPKRLLSPKIKLVSVTEDGTVGHRGMITDPDLLPDYVNWADQIFACGPMAMYRDMARQKQKLKLEGKSVQVSLEIIMGCGRGLCYGCTIKTKDGLKKVCADGPVFELDDILWDELNL